MAEVNEVIDEVSKELKTLGGTVTNIATVYEKNQKDLEAIRSEVAGLSKAAMTDPLVQQKIDAYGAAIGTRIEEAQKAQAAAVKAAEDALNGRVDTIETMLRRARIGHNGGPAMDDPALERKHAEEFTRRSAQLRQKSIPDVLDDGEIQWDAYRDYRKAFPSFLRKDERILGEAFFKSLYSGSDPDGGYLVTPEMSARILAKIYETSPVRRLASVQTISGTELEFRVDHDEVDFEWVGETDLPTASKTPQLGKKRIVAHTAASRPKATQQLLEDANVDVEAWLAGKVADKFGRGENAAFINGTGRGQPRGLLTYPAGTSGEAIEQVNTGSSSGFTFTGVINAIYSLKEGYHSRAAWMMQRLSIAKVMLVQDGDNTYLFKNVMMPGQRGLESTLCGYPLHMAADFPAVASNALCAAFGDFAAGYQIVDRLGITTQRDPFTQKPFIEFYTRRRVGGDVVNFESFKILKAA